MQTEIVPVVFILPEHKRKKLQLAGRGVQPHLQILVLSFLWPATMEEKTKWGQGHSPSWSRDPEFALEQKLMLPLLMSAASASPQVDTFKGRGWGQGSLLLTPIEHHGNKTTAAPLWLWWIYFHCPKWEKEEEEKGQEREEAPWCGFSLHPLAMPGTRYTPTAFREPGCFSTIFKSKEQAFLKILGS